MSVAHNWNTVTESKYPWERDALDFVRQGFPTHEPYRAWSNFEFIADDGSLNEVDLLVFTPRGFFLIEIKSRLGRLFGDSGTWTWETDGRLKTTDNPLFAANLKAKKLASLLQRQKVCQKKGQLPYLETLVFCSAPDLRCELQGNARFHVCLRDREATPEVAARLGILAALKHRECPGLSANPKGTHNQPMARLISQALEQAGIRPSQRHRKVSDYVLEQLIGEGPGYQDWQATHSQLAEAKRRVRLYLVRNEATAADRQTIERAGLREFHLLEMLQHPGILRAYGCTEHELGPALIFEHDPVSIRLDHFLTQRKDKLSTETRLDLLRQIAEVVRFAHDKKIVHRALCPQSILITGADSDRPRVKLFNWQVGYRATSSSTGASRGVTPTAHVDLLVEDASAAYMAPEAFADEDNTGEHLDVFSLGALAYYLFSNEPPAAGGLALSNKLRTGQGLQISSVLNGAAETLQYLIQFSTHPEVASRTGSAADFLEELDSVAKELTQPEQDYVEDPARAQPNDLLPGDLRVVRWLGRGGCSDALLVERGGEEFVLKVANDPEHNARLKGEAQVLAKLRHAHVVEFVESLDVGRRAGFLMRPVFSNKESQEIETLGRRVRREGPLHVDLLQRFGEDLLALVNFLEEQGIPHRDIKPDNIAIGMVGRGSALHLVLFDFSLSRTPPENIRAGTTAYLDPFLPLRQPPRWDLHAERYAAAITLYELATGVLPKWGDGKSDPSHLAGEITLEPERFVANLREPLAAFFAQALRRNPQQRFDNGEEMQRAWRNCFEGIAAPGTLSDHKDESELRNLLAKATFDTHLPELGLGTRAASALDRANLLTVEDLLRFSMRRLLRLRGVGNKTRREISTAVKILRERLGNPPREKPADDEFEHSTDEADVANLSIDLLADRIQRIGVRESELTLQALQIVLGLDPQVAQPWPNQAQVSLLLGMPRARVGQIVGKFQVRWSKMPAVTSLRNDLIGILAAQGGVASPAELAEALLIARGSVQDEPQRTRLAQAVVRAAVEVERSLAEPRLLVRRNGETVLIAQSQELAAYASRLGAEADKLAEEDPLAAPVRTLERLREISTPEGLALSDARLVRLAATASQQAEVSSQQELYPRGMDPLRALKLAHGAIAGVSQLSAAEIQDRIASRYPAAAPLPEHPALYGLLKEAGFEVEWDATGKNGAGCYVNKYRSQVSVTSGSESIVRLPTGLGWSEPGQVTPEEADARQFEERLQRAVKDGAFLAIMVNPKHYQRAIRDLCREFSVELVDFEGLFLDTLREVAGKAKVDWELVLQTDAQPGGGNWDKLMLLVGRVMPLIEQQLSGAGKTMLVVYAGLLARYGKLDLLERLREKVGRRDGIPGLWLLVPGDHQPMLDGKAVPIIGPGQRVKIPESWLQNIHRA